MQIDVKICQLHVPTIHHQPPTGSLNLASSFTDLFVNWLWWKYDIITSSSLGLAAHIKQFDIMPCFIVKLHDFNYKLQVYISFGIDISIWIYGNSLIALISLL